VTGQILYAGPWVGEFGWELMGWQGMVRARARDYDKVVIGCHRSRRVLYQQMPCEVEFVDVERTIEAQGAHAPGGVGHRVRKMFSNAGCNWMVPACIRPEGQAWVVYGEQNRHVPPYFCIHARHTMKYVDSASALLLSKGRNWPIEKWDAVVAKMGGRLMYAVGTREEAYCPPGVIDRRGETLEETIELLAAAQFIVGPQSGPIHLAALCCCPIIVWAGQTTTVRWGFKNWDRMKTKWNPFNVTVDFIGIDWQPTVDMVALAVGRRRRRDDIALE